MVLTEREMNDVAESLLENKINACIGRAEYEYVKGKLTYIRSPVDIKSLPIDTQEHLCNCVTKSINDNIPFIPKGKETQTRKVFVKLVNKFEKMKKERELINCTKELEVSELRSI